MSSKKRVAEGLWVELNDVSNSFMSRALTISQRDKVIQLLSAALERAHEDGFNELRDHLGAKMALWPLDPGATTVTGEDVPERAIVVQRVHDQETIKKLRWTP